MIWAISILFLISLVFNIFFLLRIQFLVDELLKIEDKIMNFAGLLLEFREHIESLHLLPMFYGEPTLKGLIDHSNYMIGEIKNFGYTFSTEENQEETSPEDEEHVLHESTSERNS